MALNKQEKERFIKDFMTNIQEKLLIQLDKVPEEWDEIELREWIADTFDWERKGVSSKKRIMEYRKEVLIKNLI